MAKTAAAAPVSFSSSYLQLRNGMLIVCQAISQQRKSFLTFDATIIASLKRRKRDNLNLIILPIKPKLQ